MKENVFKLKYMDGISTRMYLVIDVLIINEFNEAGLVISEHKTLIDELIASIQVKLPAVKPTLLSSAITILVKDSIFCSCVILML